MNNNLQKPSNEPVWETWESILLKTLTLGAVLQDAVRGRKIPPITKIVCIPRGGLHVVNVLSRQLAMGGEDVLLLGMTRFNREHNQESGDFKIGQLPRREDVEGHVVLLAEEVFDTCETAVRAIKELEALGAKRVITAAIHYKPLRNKTNFVPDFYIDETNGWIHYPWEVIDPIGTLYERTLASK